MKTCPLIFFGWFFAIGAFAAPNPVQVLPEPKIEEIKESLKEKFPFLTVPQIEEITEKEFPTCVAGETTISDGKHFVLVKTLTDCNLKVEVGDSNLAQSLRPGDIIWVRPLLWYEKTADKKFFNLSIQWFCITHAKATAK